jgi:hypothetical protein
MHIYNLKAYMFIFSIRYVLAFSIIVFLQGVLYISSPSCTCIYSGPGPQMNTVLFIIWYTEPTLGLGFLSFPSNCSWRCTCATQSSPVHRRGSFFFMVFLSLLICTIRSARQVDSLVFAASSIRPSRLVIVVSLRRFLRPPYP